MKKRIKELEFKKILEILNEYDIESIYEKTNILPNSDELRGEMQEYIDTESFTKKSVLGIDIYQYGMYKHLEQTLIPTVFKILFNRAIKLCLENNRFVFQNYTKEKIENSFISTGDGGFIIFDSPLHSLFFAINFELTVRAYNSYHLYPKLRDIIGSISLRYAITYDTVFHFDDNYYGSAIIFNSRILERDSLNRCLIDQDTYNWFLINIDGIENLQVLTINEIANIYEFTEYDRKYIQEDNEIMDSKVSRFSGIINSDISKIGQIASKTMYLNIYNLHLQVTMKASASTESMDKRTITISLGNLNTAGI